MECSACGFQNREGAKFCKMCGNELAVACPSCGQSCQPDSLFCDECGYRFPQANSMPKVALASPKTYTPKYLAEKILTTRGYIEGEKKLVTILAADVSHYTAISEKLDLESVHTIMDGCFKRLIAEIHLYEGTINQFLGDGLMAIFGAPITHEDHALRACYVALNIQKSLTDYAEKLRREYDIDFRMRIGLNTGQVVVGGIGDDLRMDYMALGDTTNIAFLLQQRAEAGKILISEKVYSHVQGYFLCKPEGRGNLKNRTRPVAYYMLLSELEKRSKLEIEAEKNALTGFVNRAKELSMMNDLFEQVKENKGQVLCIVGDAGRGKSRLIYEFQNQFDPDKVTCLESQCMAFGKNIPYGPIKELLKKNFRISEGDSKETISRLLQKRIQKIDNRLMKSMPVLLKLLSADQKDETIENTDPERTKKLIFEALRILILSGSQIKPLILVVENLQWIDNTSEAFMSYIVESIANFPVFLILTCRIGYDYPFRAKSYSRLISLTRLSDIDSKTIIQSLLPDASLPRNFIRKILDKAGGNPLYIEEMIKSLLEKGTIVKESDGFRLTKDVREIEIPETIQEIVLSRIDRLEEYSKQTIQAASVIGREFSLKLLSLKDQIERQLEGCIKELKNLELVSEKTFSPEIEYIFKNVVTKDVIYNSLLLKRRKELHKKIAQTIEEIHKDKTDDYLEMLAYHYVHSDEVDKAVLYLVKAGEKAQSVYGNMEGISFFKEAIHLMTSHPGAWDEELKKSHVGLAALYDLVGDYRRSMEHYHACIEMAQSVEEAAEYQRKIGIVCEKKGDLDEALRCYEKAMDKINTVENKIEAARISMNIGWVYGRMADFDRAAEFNNRALKIFQEKGNDYETAQVFNNLAVIKEFCGQWEEAETYNQESIRLVKKTGDQRKLASFYISAGLLNLKRGATAEAEAYFDKSYTIAEAIGNTLGMANAALNLGKVYTTLDKFAKARACFEESLLLFEKIEARSKLCQNFAAMGDLLIKMRNLDEAKRYCNEGMEIAQEGSYQFDIAKILCLLGEIKMIEGVDATAALSQSVEIFSSLGRKYELATALVQLGQAHLKMGNREEGEKHLKASKEIFETLVCACEE